MKKYSMKKNINLQDNKGDNNIDLDDEYDEKRLLFWVICYVLSLLSLINLNLCVINKCQFDLFS